MSCAMASLPQANGSRMVSESPLLQSPPRQSPDSYQRHTPDSYRQLSSRSGFAEEVTPEEVTQTLPWIRLDSCRSDLGEVCPAPVAPMTSL